MNQFKLIPTKLEIDKLRSRPGRGVRARVKPDSEIKPGKDRCLIAGTVMCAIYLDVKQISFNSISVCDYQCICIPVPYGTQAVQSPKPNGAFNS
jgi:hypothetical protein